MVTRTQKEKAYSAAMKLIAEAIDNGSQELVLADLKIQAIPKLEKPSSAIKILYVHECPALTDIVAIQEFTSLEEVHLRSCDSLTDLQVLAKLPKLKTLQIGACDKIADLSFLGKCHKLLSLELNSMETLCDISDIGNLTWLKELKIGFLDIEDLSVLAQLKNVESIEIHSIDNLKNLNFVRNLRGLRSLAVHYCDTLTNVSSIKYLEALEALGLSANSSLTKIEDIKHLKKLKNLDISGLDIDSCEFLSTLELLEFLYMSGISYCKPTFSLFPIANLPKLRELDINYTSFQDVPVLSQAPSLEFLHCKSDTPFPMETFLSSRENWPALKKLDVEYAEGVPDEIMQPKSKGFKGRVDRLKAWREDILSSGTVEDKKIKVFVLGNGSVGKTQLSRRLKGLPFDPSIQSTEGAELGRFPLLSSSEPSNSVVEAQLWDFGGQDIYLSTHGLFLDSRAIYIVAWNPECENALLAKGDHGVPVYNRPLVYWLDYIETLVGINARIIVLQTQCDTEELRTR